MLKLFKTKLFIPLFLFISLSCLFSCGGSGGSTSAISSDEITSINNVSLAGTVKVPSSASNNMISLSASTLSEVVLPNATVCLYDLMGNNYVGTDYSTPLCTTTNDKGQYQLNIKHLVNSGISLDIVEIRVVTSNNGNNILTLAAGDNSQSLRLVMRSLIASSSFEGAHDIDIESTTRSKTIFALMYRNGLDRENLNSVHSVSPVGDSIYQPISKIMAQVSETDFSNYSLNSIYESTYSEQYTDAAEYLTVDLMNYADQTLGEVANTVYANFDGNLVFGQWDSIEVQLPIIGIDANLTLGQGVDIASNLTLPKQVSLGFEFDMCELNSNAAFNNVANAKLLDVEVGNCQTSSIDLNFTFTDHGYQSDDLCDLVDKFGIDSFLFDHLVCPLPQCVLNAFQEQCIPKLFYEASMEMIRFESDDVSCVNEYFCEDVVFDSGDCLEGTDCTIFTQYDPNYVDTQDSSNCFTEDESGGWVMKDNPPPFCYNTTEFEVYDLEYNSSTMFFDPLVDCYTYQNGSYTLKKSFSREFSSWCNDMVTYDNLPVQFDLSSPDHLSKVCTYYYGYDQQSRSDFFYPGMPLGCFLLSYEYLNKPMFDVLSYCYDKRSANLYQLKTEFPSSLEGFDQLYVNKYCSIMPGGSSSISASDNDFVNTVCPFYISQNEDRSINYDTAKLPKACKNYIQEIESLFSDYSSMVNSELFDLTEFSELESYFQPHNCYDEDGNIIPIESADERYVETMRGDETYYFCDMYPSHISAYENKALAFTMCMSYWDYDSNLFGTIPDSMAAYCDEEIASMYSQGSFDEYYCAYDIYPQPQYDEECNVIFKYVTSEREECAEYYVGLDNIELYVSDNGLENDLNGARDIVQNENYNRCTLDIDLALFEINLLN